MLLYWEVVWFLFLYPTPQSWNHNLISAGFGLVIAEGWEGMKAELDWHVHTHQKTVSWREWGRNCCSAPSEAACTERHRLWGGSYLRLLRLILLEISINSHKAAPQGCQPPTAFSESAGATSILNFPTEIAVIYEFRRLINMVSWNNWIRIISVCCAPCILSDNHRRVQFWIGNFISRILITGKTLLDVE